MGKKNRLIAFTANVEFVHDLFDNVLDQFTFSHEKTLVFIDGNHNYAATVKYFRHFAEHENCDMVMVFDDIYWSGGMSKAWKEICNDKRVSLSIDLFYFGLVFFRKGISKQHYTVKF